MLPLERGLLSVFLGFPCSRLFHVGLCLDLMIEDEEVEAFQPLRVFRTVICAKLDCRTQTFLYDVGPASSVHRNPLLLPLSEFILPLALKCLSAAPTRFCTVSASF